MKNEVKTICFKGQKIYVGIDVHLKSWTVTVLLLHTFIKTFSQNPSAKELANYLRRNFPDGDYCSAYEAGFCGFVPHRELGSEGIQNIIVNAADIPTTDKERKQKEDRRDSLKIAKSLRSGDLMGIHVPPIGMVEFRSLVRFRKTTVKDIGRNKSRIKSYLYFNGISIPRELDGASKYWSARFTKWLSTVELTTPEGKMVLEKILGTVQHLRKDLLEVNRKLRKVAKEGVYSKFLQLLLSIPGIGLVSAVTLLSELDNITRFMNLDRLCSYVGLVPSTRSSGENDGTGRITKRSNQHLRTVLIECAWVAVKQDPALSLRFSELCQRMKKNDAIVRIAKKLLNRIRYVMKNETKYVYAVV